MSFIFNNIHRNHEHVSGAENGAERPENRVSGRERSGERKRHKTMEREQSDEQGSGSGAWFNKNSLSAERLFCRSRSAHMLCLC